VNQIFSNISLLLLGKRCTSHTKEAHQRFLMSRSLISRLAGQEKMAQLLLLVGLALSSIWEKARARDGQREVVGDKRQWSLICKGWDQLREQGQGAAGKGRWREMRDSGLWSARGESSWGSGCRRGQFLSDCAKLNMWMIGLGMQLSGAALD
jgi:hypothetical protein